MSVMYPKIADILKFFTSIIKYDFYVLLFFVVIASSCLYHEYEVSSVELPAEHDSFETIRVKQKQYVDKSGFITKLLKTREKFLRLCRPQKFGKSNFVQMISSFFKAKKTLFEGLDINRNQRWNFSYPVIHFDFTLMNVTSVETLQADLSHEIKQIAKSEGIEMPEIEPETSSVADQLRELILGFALVRRRPYHSAVILVDEYDWPVTRHINDESKAQAMGDFLQEFFAAIQTVRKNIRFLFMTCTMPLDLDYYSDGDGLDFVDITQDAEFEEMIGLTHEELLNNFGVDIHERAACENETFHTIVQKIKKRYNGYRFFTDISNSTGGGLYSFHSILSCFRNKNLGSFWHTTQDTEYRNIFDLHPKDENRKRTLKFFNNITISKRSLEKVNHVDHSIPMLVYMVLNGYLTYRGYDPVNRNFIVGFPNEEVREKFVKEVLEHLPIGKMPIDHVFKKCNELRESLLNEKWQTFIGLLNSLALESPSEGTVNTTKNEFAERVIRIFQICDIETLYKYDYYHDNYSLAGTVDFIAKGPDESLYGYVFEFEWGKSANFAMDKLLNFVKIQTFTQELWSRETRLLAVNFHHESASIYEWIFMTYVDRNCKDLQASHPHYVEMYRHIIPSNG